MSTTTMTSREFNQDLGKAKRAAKNGPLIVTDRGKPEHVLLSYAEFKRMSAKGKSLAEVLAMPEGADLDFEFSTVKDVPGEIDLA